MALHIVTPTVRSDSLSKETQKDVFLKLDCLQPSGSFKIRGIGLTVQEALAGGAKQIVSSSGGNAGIAAAYAASQLGIKARVIVPSSTAETSKRKIAGYGADVQVHGSVWDEADKYARSLCESEDTAYVHPFNQPTSWKGHSTIIDELLQQLDVPPALIAVSVGGGGLLMGIIEGLKRHGIFEQTQIVAMETLGADSLTQSVQHGELVTLSDITSIAKTLGAKTVAKDVFEAARSSPNIKCAAISDAVCVQTLLKFTDEHRLLVEPSCAASLAPLYDTAILEEMGIDLKALSGPIVAIVCGGSGVSLAQLEAWRLQFCQ